MHELSRAFLFEAAHTLQRDIGTEGSRRIHGHSYRATITLENLCGFLWARRAPSLPQLHRVTVSRDLSGDACSFVGTTAPKGVLPFRNALTPPTPL